MNEQLSLLIELQEIDGKIRERRGEKTKMPVQIAELDRRVEENKAALEAARQALLDAQKAKRERDQNLADGAQKVEKLKGRQSEIKTNKEYQALLKEIEAAEQENKAIEDDILKLMERIDTANAEIGAAEKKAQDESAAIERERAQLADDLARVEKELVADEQARKEFATRIDAVALAEYHRLAAQSSGKVVVEARGESCTGCYMSIPPRIFVTVKKNDGIVGCPNCHRILYFKEAIAPKNA